MRMLSMARALALVGALLTSPMVGAQGQAPKPASPKASPAPAAATPITLDAGASEAVRGFLSGLEADLMDAVRDKTGARQKLIEEAPLGDYFGDELTTWLDAVGTPDQVKSVRLTGFEVHATTWYGVLDTHDLEFFFWVTEDHARLLRLQARPGKLKAFGHVSWPSWHGQPAESFGVLAEQILRTATDGGCASLPMVTGKDWAHVLPKKKAQAAQTRGYLERMVGEARKTCDGLVGSPWHRLTWRLGDVAGVVEGKGGEKLSFRVTLTHGPERDVRVYHITKPIAADSRPSKKEGEGQ